LFVDWDQSQYLSWGPTGRTLQEVYGFDPWHITQYSVEEFIERMRGHRKGLSRTYLARIWQQAQCSCSASLSDDQREGIGAQLNYYWDIWKFHERRKQVLAEQMVAIVESNKEWIPPLVSGFTVVTRAKILAETGPLYMFAHWRALLAYAGLKVRMRSS
jgi:hypothetical protein